jgi:hypothetical protein
MSQANKPTKPVFGGAIDPAKLPTKLPGPVVGAAGIPLAPEISETIQAAAQAVAKATNAAVTNEARTISDLNLRLLEIGTANANAVLALGMKLAASKSITEAFDVWATHLRRQGESLVDQQRELFAMAQDAITTSISPLRDAVPTAR